MAEPAPTYPPGSIGHLLPDVAALVEQLLAERNSLEAQLAQAHTAAATVQDTIAQARTALINGQTDDSDPGQWAIDTALGLLAKAAPHG